MIEEWKKILFKNKTGEMEEHLKNEFNCEAVAALETEKYIVLTSNEAITHIKESIIIEKKTGRLLMNKNLKNKKVIKKVLFSFFMGFLNFKGQTYLIFVHEVKNLKFGRCNVFHISSISVFTLHNFEPDIDLSKILSSYYSIGFMFSYDMDLSDSGNFLAAFKKSKDTFKYKRNFVYFVNRYLISVCVNQGFKRWAVPVIYGRLQREVVITDEEKKQTIYFFYKESVLNINPLYQEDRELMEDFYCPTSFSTIDTFIMEDEFLKSFGLTFNNFPGITEPPKSKNKDDFFLGDVGHKKVSKYYQFMNRYLHSNNFIFSGDPEKVNMMRSSKENMKSDPNLIPIIKNMACIKTDLYSEIINAADIISERIDSFDLFVKKEEKNSTMPFISFCTERPMKDFEKFFIRIYKNFMKNFKRKRQSVIEQNFMHSVRDLKINKSTREIEFDFKHNISHLFHNIQYSKEILEKTNAFLKNDLKNHNVKSSISKIIMNLYGSRNNISKFYRKILAKTNLPVFKKHEVKISFISHNCGGVVLDQYILNHIHYNKIERVKNSDIVIIGLQEIIEMKSRNLGKIIRNSNKRSLEPWVETLTRCFPDFTVLTYVSMVGLLLMVLVRKESLKHFDISIPEIEQIKLGVMNLANKGGIYIKLKVNYDTFGIFNCHLAAGTKSKNFTRRKEDLTRIISYLDKQNDLSMSFVMGDMNFRTNTSCESASKLINSYVEATEPNKQRTCIDRLIPADELGMFFKESKNKILREFKEAPITFLPSYKWEIGKPYYDYQNGKKTPSWFVYKDR